jgi:DNA-binding LytR/AlgR family response regulator
MSATLRIVVVEDEAVIGRRVARLVSEILGPDAGDITIVTNLPEARRVLESEPPDLLLLDLNVQGGDGFDLLRDVATAAFETVVISAHTDRALDAFDLGVRDFVPKPFSRERLARALQRVTSRSKGERPLRYVGVRRNGGIEFVPIDAVQYVRGAGTGSELVLRDGSTVPHDRLLERLESVLPSHFERIHKSFIVDLRQVVRLATQEGSRYFVVLRNGTKLPVGRTRIHELRERLA